PLQVSQKLCSTQQLPELRSRASAGYQYVNSRLHVRQLDPLRTQRLAQSPAAIRDWAPFRDKPGLLNLYVSGRPTGQKPRSVWLTARRCSATKVSTSLIAAKPGAGRQKSRCSAQPPFPPAQSQVQKCVLWRQTLPASNSEY